jgi:UDP-N-acetylglucosamine 2-epimerase (non-hydrolysing)
LKVITIVGTRPEIIRLSRIMSLLDEHFSHIIVNTNQNFTKELNSIFFKQFKIRKPDYNLKINTESHGIEIGQIISETEKIFRKEKPDIILILGDTHSGLAAIPAAHMGIKIVHLEAGMRSYDSRMPEEKNRKLIDHLSSILLPYTVYSRENLIRENVHPGKIFVVGNPIIEVIQYHMPKIEKNTIMNELQVKKKEYFLVTAHRSENVDNEENLKNIFAALEKLQIEFKKEIIFPIHPRTESKIKKKIKISKNIRLIKPLGFFEFSKLEQNAFCLITDSGTIPEEALFFKIPCVTIRKSTERPEYIESGSNIMAGLEPKDIVNAVHIITSKTPNWEWDIKLGDGKTSSKVLNIIQSHDNFKIS